MWRIALRDQPRLFHAFTMNVWSHADHLAIIERVDAYIHRVRDDEREGATDARRLLERPHN